LRHRCKDIFFESEFGTVLFSDVSIAFGTCRFFSYTRPFQLGL
jgi:hypothetical protein